MGEVSDGRTALERIRELVPTRAIGEIPGRGASPGGSFPIGGGLARRTHPAGVT